MSESYLIQNATIISGDPAFGIAKGSVYIKNGKIQEMFTHKKDPDVDHVINADDMILIPGMTNSHYHSYSNLLKGTVNHFPLEIWSLYTVAYGHSLEDEDIRLAVLLGVTEMIRNGITSCVDHFPHLRRAEAALSAYLDSGFRVTFAPMMHDIPDHHWLPVNFEPDLEEQLDSGQPWSVGQMKDYYVHLIRHWHGRDGRIGIAVGPNAPQRCSEEMLKLAKSLSEKEDLKIHIHLLETNIQAQMGKNRDPEGLVSYLNKLGLLSSRLAVAHGVWLENVEIELLAKANTALIHNPASNFILGSGKAGIADCLERGVQVALGTDASNCAGPHHLFDTMRQALMLSRLGEPDYGRWLHASDVWQMATLAGGKVIGEKIGAISPGYRADLVLLKPRSTAWVPMNSIIDQLVLHESGQSVDSVMINGKWVMRNGKITAFNEDSVQAQVLDRHLKRLERSDSALRLAQKLTSSFEKMYRHLNGL